MRVERMAGDPFCIRLGTDDTPREGYRLPDLTDPATAGVLLSLLVADGWAATVYTPDIIDKPWMVTVPSMGQWQGTTLGEAAARALLALWGGRR
jgi:hypothetical protein